MGIYELFEQLKTKALELDMCEGCDYGDISLYENKEVKYPFINLDIVSSNVAYNSAKSYIIRVYSIDRNQPYLAYNKSELLLNDFMSSLGIQNYNTNFFTLNFKDVVNGCYTDITVDSKIDMVCSQPNDNAFIILENGDYIAKYLLNEYDGNIIVDNKN